MSTPTMTRTINGFKRVDMVWAHRELVPFLMEIFRDRPHYEHWGVGHWVKSIHIAEEHLDIIPFYEDFPSTIERLRLACINPSILTAAERQRFCPIAHGDTQVVSSIFVRHAIRHGTYKLYSLGAGPSPDFPREQQQDEMQRLQDEVRNLRMENQTLRGSAPDAVGGDDGSTDAVRRPTSAPGAPTAEQAAATEASRVLIERQRGALASLHASATPVQAATTPNSALPRQVQQQPRRACGDVPRTSTPTERVVQHRPEIQRSSQAQLHRAPQHTAHMYTQAPLGGQSQTPAVVSYTPTSWSASQYSPQYPQQYSPQYNPQYNHGYQPSTTHLSLQHTQATWHGFPTTYIDPYPSSFAAQVNQSMGYGYPQVVANAQQGYGPSPAPRVQAHQPRVPHVQAPTVQAPSRQAPAAAAASAPTYTLRPDAYEFCPSSTG